MNFPPLSGLIVFKKSLTGLKGEPPAQPTALETAHLSRAVVGKVLTDDINVQVQVGEVVAVVGPSGSGKSSFLRLLNRLDEPTAYLCERELSRVPRN